MGSNSSEQIQVIQDCGWGVIMSMTALCSSRLLCYPLDVLKLKSTTLQLELRWSECSLQSPSHTKIQLTADKSNPNNCSSYSKTQISPPYRSFSLISLPHFSNKWRQKFVLLSCAVSGFLLHLFMVLFLTPASRGKGREGRKLSSGSEESPSWEGGRKSMSVCVCVRERESGFLCVNSSTLQVDSRRSVRRVSLVGAWDRGWEEDYVNIHACECVHVCVYN